jgi:hypothetical protein
MYTLTDDRKSRIFLACANKTYTEVGYEFDLDKHYKSVASMKDAVKKTYAAVKNDPIKFGIDYERANTVVDKVNTRQTAGLVPRGGTEVLREKVELLNPQDIKGLMLGARNKAAKIIHEKLDRMSRSKKAIDDIGLGEMAKVVGILFDKGQIIQGQSTENIAVMSKNIDANLQPEEALDMVLRMRETTMVGNSEK